MKSDGSYYNKMHVGRRENLKGFPPTGFSVFLWFRHINKPLLYHWFCKYLFDERIYPLLAGGLYICCQGRCWVWSTSTREDDPESFIIHGRLYFSATVSCVLGFLTLTSTQFKTYHWRVLLTLFICYNKSLQRSKTEQDVSVRLVWYLVLYVM